MKNFPDFIHIETIENHEEYKWQFLDLIEIYKTEYNITPNGAGYYYDFRKKWPRPYEELANKITMPIFNKFAKSIGSRFLRKHDWWFQQYTKDTGFGWHSHNLHFAMIYYIELPDEWGRTEFYKYGQFPVNEGDVIIFPSFVSHRSKPLQSNKRKTVIASNFDVETDRDEIYSKIGKESWAT